MPVIVRKHKQYFFFYDQETFPENSTYMHDTRTATAARAVGWSL